MIFIDKKDDSNTYGYHSQIWMDSLFNRLRQKEALKD